MLLSAGDDARRDRRTTTGQPRPPVAPCLWSWASYGAWRVPPCLIVSSRPIRRLGARGGVGAQRWCSPCWLASMHALRWDNGWKSAAGSRGCSRGNPCRPPGGPGGAPPHALLAAHHTNVCGARALKALEVEAMPPPGLPQDTTTMALSGASEDEPPPEAPDPRLGLAQPAVPLASRCCSVWG